MAFAAARLFRMPAAFVAAMYHHALPDIHAWVIPAYAQAALIAMALAAAQQRWIAAALAEGAQPPISAAFAMAMEPRAFHNLQPKAFTAQASAQSN